MTYLYIVLASMFLGVVFQGVMDRPRKMDDLDDEQ